MTHRAHRLLVGWFAFADAADSALALLKLEQTSSNCARLKSGQSVSGHKDFSVSNLP